MRNIFFVLCFMAITPLCYSQEKSLIDIEHPPLGGWLRYSLKGELLNDRALSSMMDESIITKELMDKAMGRKYVGIPLVAVGTAGLIVAIYMASSQPNDWPSEASIVLASSVAVSTVGSLFMNGYLHNRQAAVNMYNQNLYRSKGETSSLNFSVNPTNTALTFRF